MDVDDRWRDLMALPEHDLELDAAAFLIAARGNPGLDVDRQLRRLDDIAGEVDGAGSEVTAEQVCAGMFGTLGLRGDEHTYDDPRNSYLDEVLNRRLGIPISLSVLLMEIGRRCGVLFEGVGMPGHFLVRDPKVPDRLIDAFSGGRQLDYAACQRLLRAHLGPAAVLDPGMLASTGPRAILARMLANLDQSFRRRGDRRSLAWVIGLRLALPDLSLANHVALATSLDELGFYPEAAEAFEQAAGRPDTDPAAAEHLHTSAVRTRAQLN